MGIAYNTSIVRDGLVLYLDAANPKSYSGSGTTWFDLSGNNRNATLLNGVSFTSGNKGGLVFDGVDDYAQIDYLTSFLNNTNPVNFTIDVWVNFSFLSSRTGLWGKNDAIEFGPISTADITLWSPRASTAFGYSISNDKLINKYNNIVLTNSSSGGVTLYLNGVQVAYNATAVAGSSASAFTLMTGAYDPPTLRYSGGTVYSFLVYDRPLNSQEIEFNFESKRGRYGI